MLLPDSLTDLFDFVPLLFTGILLGPVTKDIECTLICQDILTERFQRLLDMPGTIIAKNDNRC